MSPVVPVRSVAIAANGFGDGPAQALRDYLVDRDAEVIVISHPLTKEQGNKHVVATYAHGDLTRTRAIWTPLQPPLSYAADPVIPLAVPRVDLWVGFNPLASARGLVQRRLGRAPTVMHWSVDFTPDRFGPGTALTRLYDRLDRLVCTRADGRVELSDEARKARDERLRLDAAAVRAQVVPMGAWLERAPKVPPDGIHRHRVVFLGHLTQRQGVAALLDAVALLRSRGSEVALDVIGRGEEQHRLEAQAARLDLGGVVRFHGFVPDHRDVERLLAEASIAVAPYVPGDTVFTRYADPGKLKSYLGAGLPIVLTDVPPNARELAEEAGAELVAYDPVAIADALEDGLRDPVRLGRAARAGSPLRAAFRLACPVRRIVRPARARSWLAGRRDTPPLEIGDDDVGGRDVRKHRPAAVPVGRAEKRLEHVRAHSRDDDVLPEPFGALGAHAVHEARTVEVEALLLASSAVGDDERAPALDADEVEEPEARKTGQARAVEARAEPEARDRRSRHRMVDEEERRPGGCTREHIEGTGERTPVVQQLEAMERDHPERPLRQLGGQGAVLRDEGETVANGVRAGVDDVRPAEIGRCPPARRVVDRGDPRSRPAVQLLGERMEEVEAPEAALDVGDRDAQRATHRRAEHRRHRVPVHEDEWLTRPGK